MSIGRTSRTRLLGSPFNSTVSNWMTRGFLKGITPISIQLAGAASLTQTLSPAVDPNNCILFYAGNANAEADDVAQSFTYLRLTNSTTVTGARNTGASGVLIKGTLLELKPGILKSVQRGTTAFGAATMATQAISAVTTTKAWVNYLGHTSPNTVYAGADDLINGVVTSSTLLTFFRAGTTGALIVSWEVPELY